MHLNNTIRNSISHVFSNFETWQSHLMDLYFTILSKYLVSKNHINDKWLYGIYHGKAKYLLNVSLYIEKL